MTYRIPKHAYILGNEIFLHVEGNVYWGIDENGKFKGETFYKDGEDYVIPFSALAQHAFHNVLPDGAERYSVLSIEQELNNNRRLKLLKYPIPEQTKGPEVQHEGPATVGSNCCKIPTSNSSNCDYVSPPVKKLFIKKDEHGNYLVQVNEDGVWRGATFNEETMTLTYSY